MINNVLQKFKTSCNKLINHAKTSFAKLDRIDLITTSTIFIVSIINGFYFIIGKGVNADAVHLGDFYTATSDWELMLGRPFIQFVNMLHFGFNNHLVVILSSSITLSLSIIILRRMFDIKHTTTLVLLSVIFAVAPQFTETYFFAFTADAYLLAFLLAVISAYLLTRKFHGHYILATITVILCCGMYQAYLSVITGLFIAYSLKECLITKKYSTTVKNFVQRCIIIATGIILYYGVIKAILAVNGLELASYRGANEINILQIIIQAPTAFVQCYQQFFDFFLKSYSGLIYNGGYHRNYIYLLLFIIIGTISGIKMIQLIKNRKPIKAIILFLTIALIPIPTNIINFITLSGTGLIMLPGFLTIPLFIIVVCSQSDRTSFIKLLHGVSFVIGCILCYTYFLGNTQSFAMRNQTHDDYAAILSDIYTKATSLNEYQVGQEWIFNDIIITNTMDGKYSNGGTAISPITWRTYSGISTNSFFYSKYLSINIKFASRSAYEQIKETNEYKNMPIYPNPGSIRIINNYVVVKISKQGISQ